jgi:hypothetical protein
MDYEVIFHGLRTDIGIDPASKFRQGEFIFDQSGFATVNPNNGKNYPDPIGIKIKAHLDQPPSEGRINLDELDTALYIAEELFVAMIVETQGDCYLQRPIRCTYNGENFILGDFTWEKQDSSIHTSYARESFVDNLDFLDSPFNHHPMYHFYRAAKDETYTKDYRALNAWRFLEAYFGKSDSALVKHLIEKESRSEKTIKHFYKNVRCAVSHAALLHRNPKSTKVIIPKSYETEFDGGLFLDLSGVLKFIDSLVKRANPIANNDYR